MASINQRGGKLFFDFRWQGKRYREYTDLPDTAGNRKKAEAVLKHLENDIRKGVFDLATYFPDSPRLKQPSDAGRASPTASVATFRPPASAAYDQPITPRFQDFAEDWFDEMRPQWRKSYEKNLRLTLDAHLIPEFGDRFLADITKSDILGFRARLTEPTEKRPEGLSASRTNHILCLLKQIADEGADRFAFTTPYRGIKPLRIPRSDVEPFNLDEVKLILDSVQAPFRNYYLLRFMCGFRTAEIDGLQWRYVDFDRRQIIVAKTLVDGNVEDTKTVGSYRSIDMSPRVYDALTDQQARTGKFDYVFCKNDGAPISHRQVSRRVWYPLLRTLGLKRRRPYQTRHTAATLWLAAGENPEWIARQLGHSSMQLLSTYSRFVKNLTRQDGSAFEALIDQKFSPSTKDETGRDHGAV